MSCLRENLPFCIFHHQSPRIFLYFQTTVCTLIDNGTGGLCHFPILLGRGNAAIYQLGDKLRGKHHVILILIGRCDRTGEHGDSQRPRTHETYLKTQIGIVIVCSIGEVEHLHTHGPIAIGIEGLTRRQAIPFPIHGTATFRDIKRRKAVCQKIGIRQVIEIG